MIGNILLVASALLFMAVAVYAKVRSGLGNLIVFSSLLIALLNLVYVIKQFM